MQVKHHEMEFKIHSPNRPFPSTYQTVHAPKEFQAATFFLRLASHQLPSSNDNQIRVRRPNQSTQQETSIGFIPLPWRSQIQTVQSPEQWPFKEVGWQVLQPSVECSRSLAWQRSLRRPIAGRLIAFWASLGAQNKLRVPFDTLKHPFFDLTQVAFWIGQEVENAYKVTWEHLKHSFFDFTQVAFWVGQAEKMCSQWLATP